MLSFNSRYFFPSLIIVSKSAGLISLPINPLDILLSTLFNLLLASIIILLYFFFSFLFVFKNLLTNLDVNGNVKLKLAPIIPAGAPVTVANDAIEILPDNIDKIFNDLSKSSIEEIDLLMFLL